MSICFGFLFSISFGQSQLNRSDFMNASANMDGTKRKTKENKTKQNSETEKKMDFKSIDRKNELISSDIVVHYMYYTWCNRCVVSLNVKCAFIHSIANTHNLFEIQTSNTICYWILLLHEIHEEYTIYYGHMYVVCVSIRVVSNNVTLAQVLNIEPYIIAQQKFHMLCKEN